MPSLGPAGAAFALEPPGKNDNADFGPNEVSKEKIGEVSLDADNPYDTAAPGRTHSWSSSYDKREPCSFIGVTDL